MKTEDNTPIRSYTSGSTNDKYGYTGKERDSETNYHYFGARYGVYPAESGNSECKEPGLLMKPATPKKLILMKSGIR